MFGRITDTQGEPLIGANIYAVHTPSGTSYGNSTDLDGFYRIPGMRVGGPYTITVSYTGYQNDVATNVSLGLGERFQHYVTLEEGSIELTGVEVVADRDGIFSGNRTGQETVVDEETINLLPTVSRSIADYTRYNPLANVREDDDGFAVSLGGQNERFNTLYIDGAVNNDVFGLSDSGTNGGQTGAQPISIDAIEQFVVSVAPFDVRQSGFAGGAINAVTRSGTNEFEGSAYFLRRGVNTTRSGSFSNSDDISFPEVADFSANTFGARLGGPLIQDKLFFFANVELQRDEIPQPFDLSNYEGSADLDQINALRTRLSSDGFDMGSFDNNTSELNSEKFLVKFDYNINEKHKMSLRHSYVTIDNLEARSSSNNFLGFLTGSEQFISKTNSTALEINSIFSNSMSNNLTIGATFVRDDRDQFGQPFPEINLQDGEGNIRFGGERFSSANLLNQDAITITNDFQVFKGKHNLLFGANFEYFSAGNLFIRENFGYYQYFNGNGDTTGVDLFLAGNPADRYARSFSLVDDLSGDESAAIADFKQIMFGFYVQDDIQISDKLGITAGLRVDVPVWPTDIPTNEQFNSTTIPLLEAAGQDLEGAATGSFVSSSLLFSPRVGFTYDVKGDKSTQLRGGVGIFTSRIPLVWPGGAYNNYGLNIGGVSERDVPFVADPNNQPFSPDLSDPSNITPSGQIDLFAEDFKLPQVLKANLALDHKLPGNLITTIEAVYSKNINSPAYRSLNLPGSVGNLTGTPDTRPIFDQDAFIDPTYSRGIYLATNTNKGYSYNIAASISKSFANGIQGNVGYTWGDSYSLFDGTSSQNSSQWRGYYNPAGRNEELDAPQRSTFAAGHRVFGQVSVSYKTGDWGKQTFSFFYNGQSGNPYTYVVGAGNDDFVNDGGFSFNEVIYVPGSSSDINLVENRDGVSAADQWTALNAFIENDPYLSENRGGYAERNGNFALFEHQLDARILQDFEIKAGKKNHAFQLSFDVFNVLNLINRNWGKIYNTGFGTYAPIFLDNVDSDGVPTYTVARDIIENPEFIPFEDNLVVSGRTRSSRWTGQVGLRYLFK